MSETNNMSENRIQIGNRLYKIEDVYEILDVRQADWIEVDDSVDPEPEPVEEE